MKLLLIFIPLSIGISAFGAWFMSRYAYRFGLIDVPNNRSSHLLPTPRGGGVGILAAFIASSYLLAVPFSLWLPAALLALVSFLDDKLSLTPKTRLIFQITAAFVFVVPGLMGISLSLPVSLLLMLFYILFIVSTANFYNFMDGINGIAAIAGVVGFGLHAVFARISKADEAVVFLSLAVAAACLGFLPFNFPRARVFMGDVGSILLGFLFSVLCVVNSREFVDFLVCCGFLSTFYADTLSTLYVRWRNSEKLSQAHRRHLYQLYTNRKNVAHWRVSLFYGLLQGAIGATLLIIHPFGWRVVLVFELVMLVFWWLQMVRVRREVEGAAC